MVLLRRQPPSLGVILTVSHMETPPPNTMTYVYNQYLSLDDKWLRDHMNLRG